MSVQPSPIPPASNPTYSVTDLVSALLVLVGLLLDVANAKGWLQLDAQSRLDLLIVMQPSLVVLIGFVLAHRGAKFVAQAHYLALMESSIAAQQLVLPPIPAVSYSVPTAQTTSVSRETTTS